MTSFCTIGGCLLLMFLVRDELKNVESCISQVNRDIDEQSTKSWKILRELNVDSSIIRERREALRKLHRLSTASAIGISRKRVVVSPIEREASINTRDGYVEESKGGLDQQPGTDSVGPINGYASATYSYSPPSSFPNANPTSSQSNPYSSTGYGGSTEYGAQVEAIKKAPECKCSLTNNCPPGPEGPKGTPGMNGIDGDAGFEGVNGKDFDDIVEYTPLLNSCVTCPEGERGPPGKLGKRGARGLRGPGGLAGIPGRSGIPGIPGTIGADGAPGPDGEVGPPGSPGMDGIRGQGKTGAKGPQGPQGIMGPPGDDGEDGGDGTFGPIGERGAPGEKGETGKNGEIGAVGVEGEPGIDGEYCRCPRHISQYASPVNRIL
ncbi:hypothetical protein RB195_013435 [Necator americanus]|uniref:Collagen triple helix repeat protein n=1 Tax=Necator americanus TaxID=51031 RepID=A0ABR1DWL9_NECAM